MTLNQLQRIVDRELPGWRINDDGRLLVNGSGEIGLINGGRTLTIVVKSGTIHSIKGHTLS